VRATLITSRRLAKELILQLHINTEDLSSLKIQRFSIMEPITGEVLAVVEAFTAEQARTRYANLAPYLRKKIRSTLDGFFAVEPLEAADAIRSPIFTETFFEVIEADAAIKH
jgi:hypothetical protein